MQELQQPLWAANDRDRLQDIVLAMANSVTVISLCMMTIAAQNAQLTGKWTIYLVCAVIGLRVCLHIRDMKRLIRDTRGEAVNTRSWFCLIMLVVCTVAFARTIVWD
jgi:uncharacterized membrane protein YecN with MAPEG domain